MAKKKPSSQRRSRNPKGATRLNIPCLRTEHDRWLSKATEDARLAGNEGTVSLAAWVRATLNLACDPNRGDRLT